MKKDAYKLGANAIIIKTENISTGPKGGSLNEMLADAILCEDAG
jgi:uncharacterized protein YbjQ (UPF0145 family)